MIVAAYVRVSTQEQATEGHSIGEQTDRLKKYCEAHDWHLFKVYTDPGFSGSNMNRPALQKLLADAHAGNFQKVIVYKLDRISRSQKDTLYLIEDELLANNIDFVSMTENFDTSTPFGRAMIGILAVFAQLEREQIKERMSMGRTARAKQGKFPGGIVPMGYDYVNGEFVINEYEAMIVRDIFEKFIAGASFNSISTALNDKGYRTSNGSLYRARNISRILESKTYIGFFKYQQDYRYL